MKKKYLIIYILNTIGLLLLITGIATQDADKTYYLRIRKEFKKLESKNITNKQDINKIIYKTKLANKIYQEELLDDIKEYQKYAKEKETIDKYLINNILKYNITEQEIENINDNYSNISKKYQKKLNDNINIINKQYNDIKNIESKINNLFQDQEKQIIKDDIDITTIKNFQEELSRIPQKEIVEKNSQYLIIAEQQIKEKKQKEINNSWVKLNVPYISQNKNNILNGCEAASMLMALQYKGYLTNMTLNEYVKYMPISENNNPYEGFTHDMYGLQPLTIPHWIAPPPLTQFGKDTSGNENIVDGTGYSIDQLDRELDNNNPVIIYLIAKFNQPKETVEGAPRNLHVMLLTGYNKITNEHYIVDPWTHDDGRTSWTVSKELLEDRYNYVGKKSVIVR